MFAAVFNGVAAVPLIWFIDRIAAAGAPMGEARSGWLSRSMLALTFIGPVGCVAPRGRPRSLGLDGNPLRRASDRAKAYSRGGLAAAAWAASASLCLIY